MARYVRQIKTPPTDDDFEALLKEKELAEIQLAQEQRSAVGLKANLEQLEADLKKSEESLKIKAEELEAIRSSPARAS
ncbi:MAG: hypothetical protein JWQ35_2207 [Bacteriovoracaceae bacterium]|nr:hypothetical protein [Bacteriovoracaceae bacterium]